MFKKITSLVLVAAMLFTFVACGGDKTEDDRDYSAYTAVPYEAGTDIYDAYKALVAGKDLSNIKIGAIMIGDDEEGYTKAHHDGLTKMAENLGISEDQIIIKWTIPESAECTTAANELVGEGCTIIFANSFGHEDYLIEAARQHPEVQFCHATGYQAASSGLSNLTNYFNNVYESRYVSGIYAGEKLNEMAAKDPSIVENGKITIGYVGAFTYAEVISGYTSYLLGVRSVCDYEVEMKVKFTGSWASQELEYDTAMDLIDEGCVLISQHADTTGAAAAAAEKGVYDVGYNVSMIQAGGDHAITSATLNWGVYYTYAVANFVAGNKLATDWSEGYKTGAVKITEVNKAAFETAEAYNAAVTAANAAIQGFIDGTLQVFDTSKFTVGGQAVTSTASLEGFNGLEYIKTSGGVTYFAESTLASAPAFALEIDGITLLNRNYGN